MGALNGSLERKPWGRGGSDDSEAEEFGMITRSLGNP
jgi:hypothetical protein